MMFINHDLIFQINGGSFVSNIDFMIDRKVPDRESLKFCISGFYTVFVLMIQIAEAGGKFSAARPRSGYYDNLIFGGDIFICPITLKIKLS